MAVRELQTKEERKLNKRQASLQSIEMARDIMTWHPIDLADPEKVAERIDAYFLLMEKYGSRPLVSPLALALGIDRNKLMEICKNVDGLKIPTETRELIKKAYGVLEGTWEYNFANGSYNPITGIFLGKNHFGYTDQQDIVVAPKGIGVEQSKEEIEQKYLESVVVD